MWLFNRLYLIAFSVVLLTACGFTPVHAPGGSAAGLQGRIVVAEPDDPNSYILVQELEQRLGQPSAPAYDLSFSLIVEDEGQAVTETGEITRYSITGLAAYALTPLGSEDPVLSGEVDTFTGYSATGSTVETLAAERDARRRLMVILADRITTELYTLTDLSP